MRKEAEVEWDKYARAYDQMAAVNPAYYENLRRFSKEIQNWHIKPGEILLDLGAGTGNYSILMAKRFPRSQVWHVDRNARMNAHAREKACKEKIGNLQIIEEDVRRLEFEQNKFKAIVCINALYAFPEPSLRIQQMYAWLQPNGYLLADDVGRTMNVRDWFVFIFKDLCRKVGLGRALLFVCRNRQVIIANRRIGMAQKKGAYWTHNLDEFSAQFLTAGFHVHKTFVGYRGYSDGVICRKPGLS